MFFQIYNDVKFASDSFQAVFFVNITFLVILDQWNQQNDHENL